MLILPLHKPLDRSNFPVVTLLLVLANVLVLFGLQGGDQARMARAIATYDSTRLVNDEAPAYARWLREHGRADDADGLLALSPQDRRHALVQAALYDLSFQRALGAGTLFATPQALSDWRARRASFDAQLNQVFTERYVLRQGEWSIKRMLSSAFLHGGVMHLLGNMLFLIAIGVLLEGAIGPAALLGVYLLGALGASAASLLWRAGEIGGGLGASGAIAAMMGAFCVVWGRQPVRFFYWFGVIFDYVRAPAIWLLPLWLGWEIFSLLSAPDAGVAFDAHAGGLVCGALIGATLVALGCRRDAFIADVQQDQAGVDDRWALAQAHLGRMENDRAEQLLAELAAEQPQRFDVALARYRAARNAGQPARIQQCTRALLSVVAGDATHAAMQAEVLQQERYVLDRGCRLALAERWTELGQLKAVELLLQQAGDLSHAEQALLWFRLALRHGETPARDQQRLLNAVIELFPDLPQAQKARFLLDNGC